MDFVRYISHTSIKRVMESSGTVSDKNVYLMFYAMKKKNWHTHAIHCQRRHFCKCSQITHTKKSYHIQTKKRKSVSYLDQHFINHVSNICSISFDLYIFFLVVVTFRHTQKSRIFTFILPMNVFSGPSIIGPKKRQVCVWYKKKNIILIHCYYNPPRYIYMLPL